MKRERQICNALMRAVKEGCVPFGYYGPETCRWATPDEMRRFGLEDCPMVHLDKSGEIDCYFTEAGATFPGRHITKIDINKWSRATVGATCSLNGCG
jgi:hypothetical protein